MYSNITKHEDLSNCGSPREQRHQCRCCMVCLMPQSQVSGSFEYPHFNMFTLDRPTCLRNRLSAFQVIPGFSVPAGRCYLHNSMRAAFAVVLMGSVNLIKLFRDSRRDITPRCPLSVCLWAVSIPCDLPPLS